MVPVITFMVAVWLLAFYIMKAGKLVSFISAPVMGGFITGICTTIILMQAPKLMGGTAGTGEFPELASHIGATLGKINVPSLVLGLVSLVILLVAKKWIPKFPMAIVLMAAGAIMTVLSSGKTMGRTYIKCGRVWTAGVAAARLYCDFHERGGYHQSVSGSGDHGRDPFGRE